MQRYQGKRDYWNQMSKTGRANHAVTNNVQLDYSQFCRQVHDTSGKSKNQTETQDKLTS